MLLQILKIRQTLQTLLIVQILQTRQIPALHIALHIAPSLNKVVPVTVLLRITVMVLCGSSWFFFLTWVHVDRIRCMIFKPPLPA